MSKQKQLFYVFRNFDFLLGKKTLFCDTALKIELKIDPKILANENVSAADMYEPGVKCY